MTKTQPILNKLRAGSLALALALLIRIPTATAALVLSIDMDPSTPGIQSNLTVVQGSNFGIDLVISNNSVSKSVFETAILQIDFNDTSTILGMTGATAGSLAGMAPIFRDYFNGLQVTLGDPITSFLSTPTAPYTSTSGLRGLTAFGSPFTFAALSVTDIFGLNFDALNMGTSKLSISSGLFGGLALNGAALNYTSLAGTVTVAAAPSVGGGGGVTPIPEPSTLTLLGLGLCGLIMSRNSKSRTNLL